MVNEGVNHRLITSHPFQSGGARSLKLTSVLDEPLNILGRHVGLVSNEDHGLGGSCEFRKVKGLDSLREESVLCLLAVVVHAVPQDGEVNVGLLQKQVLLVVSVGIHEGHHAFDQVHFLIGGELVQESWPKHFSHEAFND